MKNYTVEKVFKDYPGVEQLFESEVARTQNKRGSSAVGLVTALSNLEILDCLKYFKKLSEEVYKKEYEKIYAKDVETKISNKYEDAFVPEDATFEDVKDDLQKIRKYIAIKGYDIKNFEVKPTSFLIKSIKAIEDKEEANEEE